MPSGDDTVGAFVDYPASVVPSAPSGPLAALTLAVKDIYDVAGYPTGGGHPLRRSTLPPPQRSASVVRILLEAGARFVGKTHTDEFAYSMNGENPHYGTPANPRAPGRIPGGSSSGSAAAVAAGLADIALATDTGGSVRLPASYCGLVGLRTTHGAIATDGLQPLAPSFDTVGWFAGDMATYQAVADVLLPAASPRPIERLVVATDILDRVLGGAEREAFARALASLAAHADVDGETVVAAGRFDDWRAVFRTVQAYEAWSAHGAWITRHHPRLGDGVRERFEWASRVDRETYQAALAESHAIARSIRSLVPPGTALVFPTAPSVAPLLGVTGDALEAYRARSISMLCPAGLAGLPQLTLPIADVAGLPFGISIMGEAGSDRALLELGNAVLLATPNRAVVATGLHLRV